MDADGVASLASLLGQVTHATTSKQWLKFCKYKTFSSCVLNFFFFSFYICPLTAYLLLQRFFFNFNTN